MARTFEHGQSALAADHVGSPLRQHIPFLIPFFPATRNPHYNPHQPFRPFNTPRRPPASRIPKSPPSPLQIPRNRLEVLYLRLPRRPTRLGSHDPSRAHPQRPGVRAQDTALPARIGELCG